MRESIIESLFHRRVEAFGLNNAEMLFRKGQYVADPVLPSRIGIKAAGVVDAVGPGVSGIAMGDPVGTVPYQSFDQPSNWTSASTQ